MFKCLRLIDDFQYIPWAQKIYIVSLIEISSALWMPVHNILKTYTDRYTITISTYKITNNLR